MGDMNREGYEFTYSGGLILSCLGCVLGTGNIWRFPRVLASASSDGGKTQKTLLPCSCVRTFGNVLIRAYAGSLTFILTWTCFLFAWSIPLIITEYTMGRFTRGSPLISFYRFLGPKFLWTGCWRLLLCCGRLVLLLFLPGLLSISSARIPHRKCGDIYLVHCECFPYLPRKHSLIILFMAFRLYTVCKFLATESVPNIIDSFDLKSTWYPLLMHTIGLVICGVCVFAGVQGIEVANVCLVPIQLFIVVFTFGWSLTREYADVGIQFMFTPKWSTLADPKLYVEAACQNAFDTAAGMGLFSAYAAYFTRKTSAVRYGMFLPMINNLVSLVCGFMLFATVFSTLIATEPTFTIPQIVEIMKDSGPGSTGLTFTWIPVLMAKMGVFGRVLCALFFLCLSFAGITSMISYIELTARTIQDFGVNRTNATIASLVVTFLVGVPSAVNLRILTNQDFVWGFALMISGLCYCLLVVRYDPLRYRKVIVNDFGIGDLKLPLVWIVSIA
ncbi:unnamed protein product [Schistocephalus solidus]|uniref:Sodium-dependent transporter n=1 Tax=Schistocephalus solidus TaxID=70667 RepID=A0A183SMX0_SCHSO|nr:unnamed protein product [Schistocephalus solidus]